MDITSMSLLKNQKRLKTMKNKILSLIILLSFNLNASCLDASEFLTRMGKVLTYSVHELPRPNSYVMIGQWGNMTAGTINYHVQSESIIKLDLIVTEGRFRRGGVQHGLISRMLKLYPDVRQFGLSIGSTNKRIFLLSVFDQLYPEGKYLDVIYKTHMIEDMLLGNRLPSDDVLEKAALETPTGKSLCKFGFDRVAVTIAPYKPYGQRGYALISLNFMND